MSSETDCILCDPDESWRLAFLAMAAEFVAHGDDRYQRVLNDFSAYVQRCQRYALGEDLPTHIVPEQTYWAVHKDIMVGCIRVRHRLTPRLAEIGGHIGYEIRPMLRGQGYGTQLLARVLPYAHALGLHEVLITCDNDNHASQRVIERNQGRLLGEYQIEGYPKPILRYIITIDTAPAASPPW